MTYTVNTDVLISALSGLNHRTDSADAACLALRALGKPDLAERYADAAARMTYWNTKPDHFEFAGLTFGDSANSWSADDVAAHKRDEAAYWALVSEIKSAFRIEDN